METYGICHLTLIPIRKEPSEQSEMVSQLLFGETYEVLDEKPGWIQIKTHFDNYSGWITRTMATLRNKRFLNSYHLHSKITADPITRIDPCPSDMPVRYIPGGSLWLAGTSHPDALDHKIAFITTPTIFLPGTKPDISSTAQKFLYAPYLWGGRTLLGIDCSGFTQIVFKMNGIALARDAWQQALQGRIINNTRETMPGDLAFFENAEKKIIHTGIFLSQHEIIHASGYVRIDPINDQGILNIQTGQYSHRLMVIKRIL